MGWDANGPGATASETAALNERIAKLETAIEVVVSTFEKDEAQGFRSRDRQFAIDILKMAMQP
ncbi:hypothetical protein [Bradyrhizobium sp. SZCCHNRI1073]|uniref:hypothetical protein n=1 Tax=Bradyrhizobium sp. SZCCHNRI1073 TaxID=3057280 RepID=UPI0029168905|nr:hypothetical protein [Bradyrhizobium sp. SZCCHNRI1073]